MWQNAKWLKVPMEEIQRKKIYHGDMTGRFAYFRCEAEVPEGAHLTVDISASSRYRLWVNSKPVLSGPCTISICCGNIISRRGMRKLSVSAGEI